jgi:hypothetical protein
MMEVLGRQKPDQRLAQLVAEDWANRGWMRVGNVAADWRERRCRVAIDLESPPFLDVDDAEPLQRLDQELRPQLDAWGVDQLDTGIIRGRDRRVTRLIADWAWAFRSDEEPCSNRWSAAAPGCDDRVETKSGRRRAGTGGSSRSPSRHDRLGHGSSGAGGEQPAGRRRAAERWPGAPPSTVGTVEQCM